MIYRDVSGLAPEKRGIKKIKNEPTMLLKKNIEEIPITGHATMCMKTKQLMRAMPRCV
jgi:hypothetical protein